MADEFQQPDQDDVPVVNFPAFVLSLGHTAAVHFGDVADPMSGQRYEANLPAAKQMIDILVMIEEKTRGNLSAEERQLLDQLIHELKVRFVQAIQAQQEPQSRIILP